MTHGCVSMSVLRREYNHLRTTQREKIADIRSPSVQRSVPYILSHACNCPSNSFEEKSSTSGGLSASVYKALIGVTREGLDKFF